MSNNNTRWPLLEAWPVARLLEEALAPYCERIEIVGSIRRRKPDVGDIELLFIPKMEERPLDLLSTHLVNLADEQINQWLEAGVLAKRPSKTGVFAWGAKNKLAVHVPSGIPVDLFSTSAENWWVSLVIRTGSKDTNLALTNGAIARGGSLQAYGAGVMKRGKLYAAHSEREVFELCGVPYREPEDR